VGAVGEPVDKVLVDKVAAMLSALRGTFEKRRKVEETKREIWITLEQHVGAVRERCAGAFEIRKKVAPAQLEPRWLAELLLSEKLLSQPEIDVVAELYGGSGRVWVWTPLGREIVTILDTSLDKLTLRDVLLMTLLLEPSDFEAARRGAEEEGKELTEILEKLKSVAAAVKLLL
jgi:hypothetical protein